MTHTLSEEDLPGRIVGAVVDALTGRVTVSYRNALGSIERAVINEPLCSGCDAPVSDGDCGCRTIRDRELTENATYERVDQAQILEMIGRPSGARSGLAGSRFNRAQGGRR